MNYTYTPSGVCSHRIDIEVNDGIVGDVKFYGGCPGNLLAIPKLVKGMKATDVIAKLKGNPCGMKPTSCADQLARGLEAILEEQAK